MSEVIDINANRVNEQDKIPENNIQDVMSENSSNLAIDELIKNDNTVDNNDKTSVTSLDILLENKLIDLLKTYLKQEDDFKVELTVNDEVIRVIHHIIEYYPDMFTNIEKSVVDIVKDGKINGNDIPHLLVIVKELYRLIYSSKKIKVSANKCIDITSSILKCVIHILVLEGKIYIEQDKQEEFLSQINLLIDSCVDLLGYAKTINKNCFSCFSCFSC
jgi:hypothetical protein